MKDSGSPTAQPSPSPRIAGSAAYRVPRAAAKIDLFLDGNEGLAPPAGLAASLADRSPELLRRYPDAAALEQRLAGRFGLSPEQVVVTAGADDALDRACKATLAPGREFILPQPTFEMLSRYCRLCGADLVSIPWFNGPFPTKPVLQAITPRTAAIAFVSPNNPTGAVGSSDDLRRISAAAPHALLIVDVAYAEFADEDLTPTALSLPNAIAIRTFSKAWGLAGLRVGYAIGPAEIIGWLRVTGSPYAVAGPSLALALTRLGTGETDVAAYAERVRRERVELQRLLERLGLTPLPSQGNFVLVRAPDAISLRDRLGAQGISIRAFPGHPELADWLRITCPGDEATFTRLADALQRATAETVR